MVDSSRSRCHEMLMLLCRASLEESSHSRLLHDRNSLNCSRRSSQSTLAFNRLYQSFSPLHTQASYFWGHHLVSMAHSQKWIDGVLWSPYLPCLLLAWWIWCSSDLRRRRWWGIGNIKVRATLVFEKLYIQTSCANHNMQRQEMARNTMTPHLTRARWKSSIPPSRLCMASHPCWIWQDTSLPCGTGSLLQEGYSRWWRTGILHTV